MVDIFLIFVCFTVLLQPPPKPLVRFSKFNMQVDIEMMSVTDSVSGKKFLVLLDF